MRVAANCEAGRAFVRSTLRWAIELNARDNIWSGTEYVNAAIAMTAYGSPDLLSDDSVWDLSKLQLRTIKAALDWRMPKAKDCPSKACWEHTQNEINKQLRALYHSEGKYWM